MTKILSVFSNNISEDFFIINKIKGFFKDNDPYIDFVILTEKNIVDTKDTSVLPSFYLKFLNGLVVFLNVQDYFIYKNQIQAEIILLLNQNDLNIIDKNLIKGCKILTETSNSFQLINNYEL